MAALRLQVLNSCEEQDPDSGLVCINVKAAHHVLVSEVNSAQQGHAMNQTQREMLLNVSTEYPLKLFIAINPSITKPPSTLIPFTIIAAFTNSQPIPSPDRGSHLGIFPSGYRRFVTFCVTLLSGIA